MMPYWWWVEIGVCVLWGDRPCLEVDVVCWMLAYRWYVCEEHPHRLYFHGERVWKVVCEMFLYVCWGCVGFTVGFSFHRGFTRCGIMVKRVLIMLVSFLGMKLIYLRVWVMLVWHSSMDSGLCVAVWVVWVLCWTSCGLWASRLLANHHQLNNNQSYLSLITPLGA